MVWKWDWILPLSPHSVTSTPESPQQSENDSSEIDEDEVVDEEHTLRFKVIGVTRENSYQQTLERENELRHTGNTVPVSLYPEPENPVDSKALAFKCLLDDKWCRIGYVVREALDEVHDALQSNCITSITFRWDKVQNRSVQIGTRLLCWCRHLS